MRYCRRCGGSVLEASVPKRSKVCSFVPFLSTPNSWLYKLLEGNIPNFGIYLLMIKRKQGGVMAAVKSLLVGECSVFSPPQSLPHDLSQSPTAPVLSLWHTGFCFAVAVFPTGWQPAGGRDCSSWGRWISFCIMFFLVWEELAACSYRHCED